MDKIKDNLKYIIPISFLLIIIFIIVGYYYFKEEPKDEIKEEKIVKEKTIKKEKINYFVDIKGAVNNPGVYKLEEGSRIIDVINESGGLREDADTSIINLSRKIFDEMFIVIYTKDEINKYKEETISTNKINEKIKKEIISIDKNNDAEIKKEETKSDKVNINTATKEELLTLTGIGESKAESIIKYREENGGFEKIEDIKNVSGIGDSAFEKIKENITV